MELCVKKTASGIQFLECFCGQETLFMVGKTSQLIAFRSSRSKFLALVYLTLLRPFLHSAPVSVHSGTRFWTGWKISANDYIIITGPQASAFIRGNMERSVFVKILPFMARTLLANRVLITTLSSFEI